MKTLYLIANWQELYENNRSRLVDGLKWVPIPNRHDGEGFTRLMQRADAAEVFTAWILLLQVASQSDKKSRGTLRRTNGDPHTAETLALKTRGKQAWFVKSLPVLVEMGWVVTETTNHQEDGTITSGGRQANADDAQASAADTSAKEGKKEGKESIPAGEPPGKRNLLMDALAMATGIPLAEINDKVARRLQSKLTEIKQSSPHVSAGDIEARASAYRQQWPDMSLTPEALAKHWPTLNGSAVTAEDLNYPAHLRHLRH